MTWAEVTKSSPCPICGKTDWCGCTNDGGAIRCMRIAHAPAGWRTLRAHDDGGTSFIREDAPKRNGAASRSTPRRKGKTFPTLDAAIKAIERNAGECTARWTYPESFVVARFDRSEGKDFRPFHHDGDGWRVGDPPGELPIYRRGELSGIPRVFIVEGEKCADAAWSIGMPATTSAHGSKSAGKSDWRTIAGRECIIIPDCDDEGRQYAEAVASILHRLGCSVKVIELPDLAKREDIADYIEQCRNSGMSDDGIRADIERRADAAPEYEPAADDDDAGQPVTVRLADVRPEPLRWLWPERIPSGKVTMIAGDPGLGKSLLTIDMAARVSTGAGWPDCPHERGEVGGVVLLTAEDDLADTIRPRLDAAGADVDRIIALQAVQQGDGPARMFNLATDLPALDQAIRKCDDCRLVIVDPITAYLGRTDSHKNAEVRGLLAPLSDLAGRHGVAVVCVSHLNKGGGAPAMYRTMGSLAFVAAARAAWAVTKDRDDPARRLMLPVKMNLAAESTGLAYTVGDDGHGRPQLRWEAEPVTMSADDALGDGEDSGRSARDEAEEWLTDVLAGGRMPAKELKARAENDGIAERTLNRAKKQLGVVSARTGFADGAWCWRLPDDRRLPSEGVDCQSQSVANYGDGGNLRDDDDAQPAGGEGGDE